MSVLKENLCGAILVSALGFIGFLSVFPFSPDFKGHRILDGELARHYEESFDDALIHSPLSVTFWKYINYHLFGEAVRGALIGNDGWLFTEEEFSYSESFWDNIKNNQNYITSIVLRLKEQGTQVVIVPIPSKARLFSDQLGRYQLPAYRKNMYQDFSDFLQKKNIDFVNLDEVLEQNNFFFKTDTHWTPEGARVTAQNVSSNIKPPKEVFVSKAQGTESFSGDLVKYTVEGAFQQEEYTVWKTTKKYTKKVNLFKDQYFSVVLVGTSYSADPRWNFEGFIKESLQADVLNFSDEGKGPFEVMENYLKEYQKKPPKLIIWEIPERYLSSKFQMSKNTK